ncbi:MAG: cytochrome c [Planctomycetota bacterium]|nr:cytochrome c [Planctomycetota bacterium]
MISPAILLVSMLTVPSWEDVRPIVARQCAVCHRPGGEGPFRLDRASDLAARRSFVKAVIQEGLMPPWLPVHGAVSIQGRGPLTPRERQTLLAWLDAGAPYPKDAKPALPMPANPPSDQSIRLVLEEGFDVPAESEVTLHAHTHNVRTFALPVVNDEPLLVTGFHWDSPLVNAVHSVALSADPTGQAELADSLEDPAGYHMSGDVRSRPAGGLGVLGVGARTLGLPEGFAFEIPAGSTLVTEMSYRPTGRDLPVTGTVTLDIAHPEDVVRRLDTFVVMKPWFKLAAGERRVERGELEIPMDLDIIALSPRGDHFLRSMQLIATPPGGEPQVLLDYPDWDMHWRQTEVLTEPLRLKAGTRLEVVLDVDNTDDNPRNLSYPAKDVTLGRFTGVDGVLFHAAPALPEKEVTFREWIGSLRR